MHRALAISELLALILGDLYNDDRQGYNLREGIKDIARVARVCRAFRDPALDFLWRHIDCLFPLLRLLPLESREEYLVNSRLSKTIGDLKSLERQHYTSISNRVRTLSFSEHCEPIPCSLVNDIVNHALFLTPRIQVLHLHISSEAGLRLIPAFLTPELIDISLSLDEDIFSFSRPENLTDLIKSAFMTIFKCTPKLVHFSAAHLHEALPSLSLPLIPAHRPTCLQSLTHVTFYITTTSLQQVLILTSQLSKLEDLTVQVCEEPFEDIPRLSLALGTFSLLKNITLGGCPEVIHIICSALPSNCKLQSAVLRMRGLHTNADIALVFSGLVATSSRESLRKIIMTSVLSRNDLVQWDLDSGTNTHQFILDMRAIEPALQFPNLEIFSACLGVPFYLVDEDHLRIAQAWRSVQLLYLSSIVQRVVTARKSPASLASLAHYARYCHSLRALGLYLDASTEASVETCMRAVDAYDSLTGNVDLPSPSIQMVEFGPSWVECDFDPTHIISIARAFTRLFSNLAACRACRTEELGVPQAAWTWMKIQTLYEYMLFVESGHKTDIVWNSWKLKLFSKWTLDYERDYEMVTLVAPGSSVEAGFEDAQNAAALNQMMYKAARNELARISNEQGVV